MKMDKQSKILLAVCAVVYPILFGLCFVLIYQFEGTDKNESNQIVNVQQEEPTQHTIFKKQPKQTKNPLLELSVSLCKNEYAEEIARNVLYQHEKTGLPLYVIYALIGTESDQTKLKEIEEKAGNFNPHADEGGYGCIGLLQVSPKFALVEYNKSHEIKFTERDLYKIDVNLEVGLWYYKQWHIVARDDYVVQYVIYNVGYSRFNKTNKNWFYGWDGKWYCNYKNSFFFMNDLMPPTKSYKQGLYGKEHGLPPYNAKRRFEAYLEYYEEKFSGR